MLNKKNVQNVNQTRLSNKEGEGISKDIYVKNVTKNFRIKDEIKKQIRRY